MAKNKVKYNVSASQSTLLSIVRDLKEVNKLVKLHIEENNPEVVTPSLPTMSWSRESKKYHVSEKKGNVTLNQKGFSVGFGSCENSLIYRVNDDCKLEIFTRGENRETNPIHCLNKYTKSTSYTEVAKYSSRVLVAGYEYMINHFHYDTKNMDNEIAMFKSIIVDRIIKFITNDDVVNAYKLAGRTSHLENVRIRLNGVAVLNK